MNTKLTLRLEDHLIESAKEYSARTGKSVSRIVSDFFEIIRNEKIKQGSSVTPTVNLNMLHNLMSKVARSEISGFLYATTVTTIHYLLSKYLGKEKAIHSINSIIALRVLS